MQVNKSIIALVIALLTVFGGQYLFPDVVLKVFPSIYDYYARVKAAADKANSPVTNEDSK